MKSAVLITGLLVILFANLLMVYYRPYGIDNFQNVNAYGNSAMNTSANSPPANAPMDEGASPYGNANAPMVEGFSSYNLASAGGAKQVYKPMGQFDGVKLSTGNTVSDWRYTAPNEPLTGPEFEPGDDSLFMFKNNQCKPECCGASFSCGGGCVCTTPQQRQYIAGRGGNRNAPEDSA
jgi:hypothetical protein